MQEVSKQKSKDAPFESLRILSERWKNGTFSEIIDDWKWIFGYSARYKGAIVFYTILGILSTSLGLVGSVAGKYLIDIITGYQIQKLPLLLCIMIGSTVFSLGFESVINRISTKLGIAINNDIQADIFDKIVDADWLEISKYANGDVLNRFNGDIGTVSGNAISWLPTIIIAVYRFIATFFVILHYDWVMALIAFLSAPFLLLMSRFMIRRQREYSKEVREMSSNLMSFEVEAFYNFDTIKSFGIAPYYSKKMRWWQGLFKDISLKYNLFTIKTNIVMSILGSAVEFTAFGYCLFRLWTHDITYGTMTLFLQQRSNLSGAFGNVISIIPSFLNSSVSAHRIRELVELPKEVHIPDSAKLDPLAKDGFRVQMHGVEFSYIEGNKVITRSEFQAAPGEIVALVGPSGEGKTTMIRLILGLIRPQEGETVIIASNGKTVPMNAETRHLFAYVPQGNTILSGTIAENMRMVKEDATDEEIIEALKISCAWDFVQHLPDTINSRVGERGRGFSEGQSQRLAIARAVLRAGKDLKPRPLPPDGLMVCTVDRAARAVQLAQKARRGVDGMQPVNAVNLTVALDVLTQRAAKIDVEDLQPAADADDRLSRAQEVVNQRELTRVACFVEIFRAVQCLTVKARVHVAPAGQQQNVRVLRRFGERRTDQRERIFVIFQAYR